MRLTVETDACVQISQEDRDKVASEWADIRHAREAEAKRKEQEDKVAAMVQESEGVAMNIAKVEKRLEAARAEKAKASWMDVVMGD